jgi:uncharacterized integral membrane protein (TIGR00697 family)
MSNFQQNAINQQRYSPWFVICVAIFITCLITSNIIAVKLFTIFSFVLPVAIIIFPISYIVGDVLTEVYGYAQARRVIWLGFLCNLVTVLAIWLGQLMPPASFWKGQAAYEQILGYTPRILIASFLAYLVGEFVNSFVLAKMKIATEGRWLWTRTIGSTVVGQGLDSLVFIMFAFVGTMPVAALLSVVFAQWLTKSAYEAAATPLTYIAVNFLKRKEGLDTFDRSANFNPFSFKAYRERSTMVTIRHTEEDCLREMKTELENFNPTDPAILNGFYELSKKSLEEVKHLTEYEDEKANRILTAVAFLSALGGLLFVTLVPRNYSGAVLGLNNWNWPSWCYYVSFALFLFFLVLGTLLVVWALKPRFNIPPSWGKMSKSDSNEIEPSSFLFFEQILKTGPQEWAGAFCKGSADQVKAKYIKCNITETYLVSDKIRKKLNYMQPGIFLLWLAVIFLGIWLVSCALLMIIPPGS